VHFPILGDFATDASAKPKISLRDIRKPASLLVVRKTTQKGSEPARGRHARHSRVTNLPLRRIDAGSGCGVVVAVGGLEPPTYGL
jgi:hypothetical protein